MLGINPESRDDWGVAKVSMQRRAPRASAIACVCYCSLQSALDPAILYRHCVIARDIHANRVDSGFASELFIPFRFIAIIWEHATEQSLANCPRGYRHSVTFIGHPYKCVQQLTLLRFLSIYRWPAHDSHE